MPSTFGDDEALLTRIQNYVSNDLNSKIPPGWNIPQVAPKDVFVVTFTRVFAHWKAFVTNMREPGTYYEIVHDGSTDITVVSVYTLQTTQEAII